MVSLTGSSYNINPNPNRKNVPIEASPRQKHHTGRM